MVLALSSHDARPWKRTSQPVLGPKSLSPPLPFQSAGPMCVCWRSNAAIIKFYAFYSFNEMMVDFLHGRSIPNPHRQGGPIQMSISFSTSPIHILIMSIPAMQLIKIQLSEAPLKIEIHCFERVFVMRISRRAMSILFNGFVMRSAFFLCASFWLRKIRRLHDLLSLNVFRLLWPAPSTSALQQSTRLSSKSVQSFSRRGHVRRKRSVAHHRVLVNIYNVLLPFEFRVWKTTKYRNAVETCDPPPWRRSSLWAAVFLLLFVMLVFFFLSVSVLCRPHRQRSVCLGPWRKRPNAFRIPQQTKHNDAMPSH